MQTVKLNKSSILCTSCGADLTILGNFTYIEENSNTATTKNELCKCNKCGEAFILCYDFFDENGHVNNFIFSGDINDPNYNWQDQLTKDQKEAIGNHLKTCTLCNNRLLDEMGSDAWLAALIHSSKKSK